MPVLALCQLNRAVEGRDDKRPTLADLRDSGMIEQDADVVLLLCRNVYYLEQEEPPDNPAKFDEWQSMLNAARNVAEVLVAKQRSGPTGKAKLFFDSRLVTFGDLEEHYGEGGDALRSHTAHPPHRAASICAAPPSASSTRRP